MRYRDPITAAVAARRTFPTNPHYRMVGSHGYRALVAEYLVYEPDTSNGRVTRRYGRAFIRYLSIGCQACADADRVDGRLHRIRAAYGRRRR